MRAIGLSNETPYGVHEFVRLAQHGLPRVATVQNPYCLINRSFENALDGTTCYRLGVGLLAYSPLGFGLLTGKYDETGLVHAGPPQGRMALFEHAQTALGAAGGAGRGAALQRAGPRARPDAGAAGAGVCYHNWRVASTIIGVTSLAQLDACLDAWDVTLSPELLEAIDRIRWEIRDTQ